MGQRCWISAPKIGPTEAALTAVLTTEGTIMGTPQYMAPEQFGGREADARPDIRAFGAVLYEMVTGQKAFQGKSYSSLVGAILPVEPGPMGVKAFTPDGKRLAAIVAGDENAGKPTTHLTFPLHFFDEPRRRAPGGSKYFLAWIGGLAEDESRS